MEDRTIDLEITPIAIESKFQTQYTFSESTPLSFKSTELECSVELKAMHIAIANFDPRTKKLATPFSFLARPTDSSDAAITLAGWEEVTGRLTPEGSGLEGVFIKATLKVVRKKGISPKCNLDSDWHKKAVDSVNEELSLFRGLKL